MKSKTIINALQKQLSTLDDDKLDFNSMWAENTLSYLSLAFEKEDELTKKFTTICNAYSMRTSKLDPRMFPKDYVPPVYDNEGIVSATKDAFRLIIISAIDRLKTTGIEKHKEGNNILHKLSNGALIGYAFTVIAFVFTAGTLWGKYLSDTQNVELKIEVKDLKKVNESLNATVLKQTEQISGYKADKSKSENQ